MSDKAEKNDGPLSRWSRRKAAVRKEREAAVDQKPGPTLTASLAPNLDSSDNKLLPVQTDAELTEATSSGAAAVEPEVELPDIDSLNEDSDYSAFMSPNVSGELRNLALRKLFKSSVFNIRDGLDDYDEDFTTFEKLGDIVTADMRHHAERKEKERLAREQEELNEINESNKESTAQADHEQAVDDAPTELAGQQSSDTATQSVDIDTDAASAAPAPLIRPTDTDATLMSGKIRRRPDDQA